MDKNGKHASAKNFSIRGQHQKAAICSLNGCLLYFVCWSFVIGLLAFWNCLLTLFAQEHGFSCWNATTHRKIPKSSGK